jgi:hypothetical protein
MKRWLAKIVVFLLLGAIINVAVAWGFAIWGSNEEDWPTWVYAATTDPGFVFLAQHSGPGFSRVTAVARRGVVGRPRLKDRGELLPHWARDLLLPSQGDRTMFFSDARGWPVLSFRSVLTLDYVYDQSLAIWVREVHEVLEGFPLPRKQRTEGVRNLRAIPLRPIWPGFAINTIFFAAIFWLVALTPVTARRLMRHKRGHCIKCGYDLRGDLNGGCPECGWNRAVKPTE